MHWNWNPSIEPTRNDEKTRKDYKVYLVVDGLGHDGRIFRERAPIRVVAINSTEHRVEDASEDIALEILRRADLAGDELTSSIKAFVDSHLGPDRQLTLRLA